MELYSPHNVNAGSQKSPSLKSSFSLEPSACGCTERDHRFKISWPNRNIPYNVKYVFLDLPESQISCEPFLGIINTSTAWNLSCSPVYDFLNDQDET